MVTTMAASSPPSLGSVVAVPGDMHGTVRFVGPVAGKKGMFAGVQLASEFAARGKNSGDVDGKHYFRTTVPGSGIFLPIEKAIRMEEPTAMAPPTRTMGAPATPKPNNALATFNRGGRTPSAANTLGALPKPNFSQSMGPGMRPSSPAGKGIKRDSLPRPASPLRKGPSGNPTTTPAAGRLTTPKTRPSIGLAKSTVGTGPGARFGAGSPAGRIGSTAQGNKFSQSLRQSMVTPSKGLNRQITPLGPEASFDEEPEGTGATDSGTATPTPAATAAISEKYESEIKRLKESLDERERALRDQAASIGEMEKSLTELQRLIPLGPESPRRSRDVSSPDEDLPADVQSLRLVLREKNDKIKALIAEFDANRADFRSTIDTLELASSETERVYEKRVDDLLEENRNLQDRSQGVDEVTMQFRQLEELVQELEEGLEDARRGESEARAENEFLKGEVERLRSEMKKLREVNGRRTGAERPLSGEDDEAGDDESEFEQIRRQLDQRDDEVRGLKAMITEMNQKNVNEPNGRSMLNGHNQHDTYSSDKWVSQQLEDQIRDLRALLSQKSDREEELENEVSRLRSNSYSRFPAPPVSTNRNSADTVKHRSGGTSNSNSNRLSDRTVVPTSSSGSGGNPQTWHDASSNPTSPVRQLHSRSGHARTDTATRILDMVHERPEDTHKHDGRKREEARDTDDATESQSGHTDASSTALWCEICEEGGHDILTCRNMFGTGTGTGTAAAKEMHEEGGGRKKTSSELMRERMKTRVGADETDRDRPAPLRTGSWKSAHSNGAANDGGGAEHGSNGRSSGSTTTTPRPSISMLGPLSPAPSSALPPPPPPPHSALPSLPPSSAFPPSSSSAAAAVRPWPPQIPPSSSSTTTTSAAPTAGTPENQAGMVAGKATGKIDPEKWCALCERDGHESVDCPFEDSF